MSIYASLETLFKNATFLKQSKAIFKFCLHLDTIAPKYTVSNVPNGYFLTDKNDQFSVLKNSSQCLTFQCWKLHRSNCHVIK